MISKSRSNGRRSSDPLVLTKNAIQLQALVISAEIVDATHQNHQWFKGLRIAEESPASASQQNQTGSKCSFLYPYQITFPPLSEGAALSFFLDSPWSIIEHKFVNSIRSILSSQVKKRNMDQYIN